MSRAERRTSRRNPLGKNRTTERKVDETPLPSLSSPLRLLLPPFFFLVDSTIAASPPFGREREHYLAPCFQFREWAVVYPCPREGGAAAAAARHQSLHMSTRPLMVCAALRFVSRATAICRPCHCRPPPPDMVVLGRGGAMPILSPLYHTIALSTRRS